MSKLRPIVNASLDLPRVIAVTSGKGGVGKSSICINLGISLAKTGANVCLLDADTGLANANILLGLTPEFSLDHVLYGAKAIEDVMMDGPFGLKIIPGANGISECVSLHPRQQLRLTRELARIENDFDFLLVDTAAGVTDTTLDFISASQFALIVITPEPTSLTDAFSMIKLLKRRSSDVHYQIVVNMAGSAGQAKEVYHRFATAVEKYIGVDCEYLGFVLRDESMRAAVVLQNPVTMFPDSDPSCRSFTKLADKLDKTTEGVAVETAFSSYWQHRYSDQIIDSVKTEQTPIAPDKKDKVVGDNEKTDTDYLSDLRSRVLPLIQQSKTSAESIQAFLQESQDAFTQRFEYSPIDVLKLIETILASPERDDQLLREIAERVRPWITVVSSPENLGLSLLDMPQDEDAKKTDEQLLSVPAVQFEIMNEKGDITGGPTEEKDLKKQLNKDVNGGDNESDKYVKSASSLKDKSNSSGYDSHRFGSQESIVEWLKTNTKNKQSLAELLYSFQR